MDISLDNVAKLLQFASAIWVLIFGGKGLIEIFTRKPPPGPGPPPIPPAGRLDSIFRRVKKIKRSTLLNVILAIVVLVVSSLFLGLPCPPFAPTSVTITSPASNSGVSNQITVQGTACHIPAGKELWLLVTVGGVSGYFPQGDATNPRPITVESDGTWSVAATLGTPADIGKKLKFTLIPALVDQNDTEAENAIHNYFKQSGVYVGIQPLPSGIRLMSPISVILT